MNQEGKLFLIPSPLFADTQFEVLTLSTLNIVKSIKYFLVENERSARRFLISLKTEINVNSVQLTVLDKDTKASDLVSVLEHAKSGHSIGVISEAGCPGVADPGSMAVAMAHQLDIQVVPLVGPSSILLALMGSGFNGQSFLFHGYLPIEKAVRVKTIKQLEKEAFDRNQTQIFIETPYRNNIMFQDLLAVCQNKTLLCIASELTSAFQFLKTKPVSEWKKEKVDLNKKPTVFLMYFE